MSQLCTLARWIAKHGKWRSTVSRNSAYLCGGKIEKGETDRILEMIHHYRNHSFVSLLDFKLFLSRLAKLYKPKDLILNSNNNNFRTEIPQCSSVKQFFTLFIISTLLRFFVNLILSILLFANQSSIMLEKWKFQRITNKTAYFCLQTKVKNNIQKPTICKLCRGSSKSWQTAVTPLSKEPWSIYKDLLW